MKRKQARLLFITIVILIGAAIAILILRSGLRSDESSSRAIVNTIAGAPLSAEGARFGDPFGIAVDKDGDLYVTDGDKGKLWQIKPDGGARVVVEGLNTPSGLALAPDGSLVIAETGAHVITRVYPVDGRREVLAGTFGHSGFADGSNALFNGPIGVAVGEDGTVYVADTYNDRIRAIERQGIVRTIAGGQEAGFKDAEDGTIARFDTPCGIAIAPDKALIVADTGNHSIRRIEKSGSVRTISGTGTSGNQNGFLFAAEFSEPIGVAVDIDGTIYIADSGGSAIRGCGWNLFPRVWTLAGGTGAGFHDGGVESVRMNHPTGIALATDGTVFFADNGNRLVRCLGAKLSARGVALEPGALASLWPSASEIRAAATPRWPYDPPERPREIAATFGEIRGEVTESDKQAWFHNGLDIPGGYGETVHAIRTERILNPLAVKDVGSQRERIRFPMLGYIHLRIGRDASDRNLDDQTFLIQRDAGGRVTNVRVRRGTEFTAGAALGTLNNQNHVHLTAGPIGREFNALAALELPGIKDSVAPTIERDGIGFFDSSWHEIKVDGKDARVALSGDVRIVVRAYDQMDGNAARRRLGIYRIGYQVLSPDKSYARHRGLPNRISQLCLRVCLGMRMPLELAYASGSRSGATGETIFAYIVTNVITWHGRERSVLLDLEPPGR